MQLAQAIHAAFTFAIESPETLRKWHEDSNYLVVVSVPDEKTLLDLADEAHERFIRREIVYEPDLQDQATCLALQPGALAAKLCASLPLALRNYPKLQV